MSLIARLIEAGTPPELVAEVAMELGRAQGERDALERRRSADRERQQERRDRLKAEGGHVTSRDVTDVTDVPALSPSPNENNSNPHPHTHPDTKPRARKGHRLPSDWEPQPLTGDIAKAVALWPPGAIERELAKFRDWAASATGPNATKSDWQAAWRNWLRRADEDGKYRSKPQQSGNSTRNAAQGALLRLAG